MTAIADALNEYVPARSSDTPARRFARRFLRQRVAVAAGAIVGVVAVIAIAAPLLSPHDPDAQNLRTTLLPPFSDGHLLGTDHLGRDVLSRLLFGARVSLLAAVQAVGFGALFGIVPGLLAGYFSGWLDWIVMRINDAFMAFPPIILAITVLAALGPGLTNAMLAVGIVFAPRFTRMTRASTLAVREEAFVEAVRSAGLAHWRILARHVVPHVVSPLIVMSSVLAGAAMVIEAGLSFVGLGVQPPESSWGSMLSTSFRFISNEPLLIVWPGVCVAVTVLALNLLGDGIRDSLGKEIRRP